DEHHELAVADFEADVVDGVRPVLVVLADSLDLYPGHGSGPFHDVSVTFWSPMGRSTSRPRCSAAPTARSWAGMTATSGESHSGTASSAIRRPPSPASLMTVTSAPRELAAASSSRIPSRVGPDGAMAKIGKPGSTIA